METPIDYGLLQHLRHSERAKEILSFIQKVHRARSSTTADDSVESLQIAKELGILVPNAVKCLDGLGRFQAIEEVTQRKRGRRYRITPKGQAALIMISKEEQK